MARRTLLRTLIVKARMFWADIRGHHGKVGITNQAISIWVDTIKENRLKVLYYVRIEEIILNAINFTKENLLDTDDQTWEKKYPPFVINKCLSVHYDCIAQANEMNGYHFLDKKYQFHFYINSIRKKKRFGGKWLSQAKLKNLEYVKEYYGYSNEKAKDALNILTENKLN